MTVAYGPLSAGWLPSGAQAWRYYRGYVDYSTSVESPTSFKITAKAGVYLNMGVSKDGYSAKLGIGTSKWSGSGSTSHSTSPVAVCFVGNHSVSYIRGISDYTVNIFGQVACTTNTGSGGWTGAWSTASVNITVPALDKYTVSFNMNGHGTQVPSQSISYGYTATKPTDPTDAHYGFLGWYSDVGLTVPFDFNTTITSNITLYAKWIKLYPTTRAKVSDVWYKGEFRCKMNNQICDVVDGYNKVNNIWLPISKT